MVCRIRGIGGISCLLVVASFLRAGASFASRGREVFAKYCGHDVRWVQPPVEGLELLQLQVIHRHGARSLWAPLSCWAKSRNAPIERPPLRCNLPVSISAGGARPLTKRFDEPGGCGLGSLLDEAPEQFRNLAWSLNASYQHTALWKQLNPTNGSVYLYACDNERNLASADLLATQLFAGSRADVPVPVHTHPVKDDPFQLSGYVDKSPCDGSPVQAIQEIQADQDFQAFASAWLQHANVSWHHMNYDCILTTRCAGLTLPVAIDDALADEALYWGWLQQMAAVRTTNWTSLVASRALDALRDQLKMASHGRKLVMWSTHDSTMMYLLNALEGFDNRWPGYASSVLLELYAGPSGERILRVVRDGEPITLGVCGEVLCPLSRFVAAVDSWQDWGCAPADQLWERRVDEGPWWVWALLGMMPASLLWIRCRRSSPLREPLIV